MDITDTCQWQLNGTRFVFVLLASTYENRVKTKIEKAKINSIDNSSTANLSSYTQRVANDTSFNKNAPHYCYRSNVS